MTTRLTEFYYSPPQRPSAIPTDAITLLNSPNLAFKPLLRTRTVRQRRRPQFPVFAENKGGGGGGEQKEEKKELFRWKDLLEPDPENILAIGLTAILGLASLQALWQLVLTSLAILLGALKYSFIAAVILFILITLL